MEGLRKKIQHRESEEQSPVNPLSNEPSSIEIGSELVE
jgi:hypothetical protein